MKVLLKKICVMMISGLILSACSSSGSGGSATNGQLSFNQSSYQLKAEDFGKISLNLTGSTNASGVAATISSSNPNVAVIVNNTCVLSDESGFPSSCEITVKALAAGVATITASAAGVVTASATVDVSNNIVPGTLTFTPAIESIVVGGDKRVQVTLNGSSGVSNLPVSINSADASIANPIQTSCILSTEENSCNIIIDGNQVGTTVVTASATGYYGSATNTVQVTSAIIPGTLSFKANKQLQVGNSEEATLSLIGSSGVSNLTVSLNLQNPDITIEPNTCILSSSKPDCYIRVTGVSAGSDKVIATASGYSNAGAIINVISNPVKGSLYFEKSSESVVVNASGGVELLYSGGSGIESLPVTLSVNNSNITISPLSCNMNNIHDYSTCKITISGINQGQSVITAHADGYPDATNIVNVESSGVIIYGNLTLQPANSNLIESSSIPMTLSLLGSSGVNDLVVDLASSSPSVASLSISSCTLSSISNKCTFNVTGKESGVAIILANDHVAPLVKATVTVNPKAGPQLVFSPDELILSNQNMTAQTATLTLVNPSSAAVYVSFPNEPIAIGYSPGFCNLSQESPSCVVSINNAVVNGPTGTFYFNAVPSASSGIASRQLPIILAPATAVSRTITVINKCPFTVYAGITGSAANLTKGSKPGTCPNGTIYDGIDESTGFSNCYWKNPTPTNESYGLAPNQQTQFVIPTSTLDTVGTMWNGGIMARLQINGSWAIGDCSGGQESVGNACALGVGFNVPETVAEFNLTPEGVDTYDLQLIDGVTVPISITPDAVTADSGNPYNNGIAGATTVQTGSQYTLFASSWEFTPTIFGTTTSTTYYNYVSGVATDVDQCSNDAMCSGNLNGPVCGYAANSLSATAPTYTRVCGYRLAYLTAAAIYTLNPHSNNTAPFDFNLVLDTGAQSPELPYPNSNNNPMHDFYLCNSGAAQSGYQASTVYPQACGCSNWNLEGIATPTSQCQGTGVAGYTASTTGIGFNSAWINQVLPRVKWVKQGCPTCYSFQYDDPSSTFQGYKEASSSNAANAVNYTVTFCPSGKTIPDYDPNLN